MAKKNTFLTIFVLLFILIPLSMIGQHNTYGIDDKLYDYFIKCSQNRVSPQVLKMCDTLFIRSARIHEVKAQCMALYIKGMHYKSVGDTVKFNQEMAKLYHFSKNTNYKQYYFSLWNQKINMLIGQDRFQEAMRELDEYQKYALKCNNKYGIAYSYQEMGHIYYVQGLGNKAIEEYQRGLRYAENFGLQKEAPNFYSMLGYLYFFTEEYDKSIENYQKTLDGYCEGENYSYPYMMLANSYFAKGDQINGIRYYNLYKEWIKKHPHVYNPRSSYYLLLANYYSTAKDYDRALLYCDSISGELYYNRIKSDIFAKKGDYKNAYLSMIAFAERVNKNTTYKLNNMIANYSVLFDNQKLQADKSKLALTASEYKVKQLQTQQKLILVDRDRKLLVIGNNALQLRNKDLMLMSQHAEMLKQKAQTMRQHDKANNLEQIRIRDRHLYGAWIVILSLIVIFAFTFSVVRFLSEKRLKREIIRANKAQMDAEKARQEAENADRLKSSFLQNVSHEIRTPLNAIVGFTELLTAPDCALSEGDKRNFSKLISTNSDFLTTLVNDVLDLSKLESGNYQLLYSDVNLNELCEHIVTSLLGTEKSDVKMIFERPRENLFLYTDRARLHQVIVNFLTNACKYTDEGSIVLTYTKSGEHVIFSVTDTGRGIASEDAQKVFDRFEKLGSFEKGTGIGLNICMNIARLLNGEVKLDTTYKQGARFLFILPYRLALNQCTNK